jgi:hypothetical protein
MLTQYRSHDTVGLHSMAGSHWSIPIFSIERRRYTPDNEGAIEPDFRLRERGGMAMIAINHQAYMNQMTYSLSTYAYFPLSWARVGIVEITQDDSSSLREIGLGDYTSSTLDISL